MPPSLRDFAEGGRYFKADPPLKPMSGVDFEKSRRGWEQEQPWKAAWEKKHAPEGSSSGGAPRTADEEEEAEEGEDPLFLEAVAASTPPTRLGRRRRRRRRPSPPSMS
jgi:hypothetical protein